MLKDEIMKPVQAFYDNAALPKVITSSFTTLAPKIEYLQSLGDFRQYSLVGSLYKIVAKIMSRRLKKIFGHIISPWKIVFLNGLLHKLWLWGGLKAMK